MSGKTLLVIGASARAVAFSAARGGFEPYWIDQFGDADLSAAFPGARVDPQDYPAGLLPLVEQAPEASWMYSGALENHRHVLDRLANLRPLLGNDRETCDAVRDPWRLRACLQRRGIASPELAREAGEVGGARGWLLKPRDSAGGFHIAHIDDGMSTPPGFYLQRHVPGESLSAVFVGNGRDAQFIAATRQLVGEPAFHAGEFSYCGSIGPLGTGADDTAQWDAIGKALASEFHLRGLFGVDAVQSGGDIVPIEVNPRYTASVEVIERATDVALVPLHCGACAGDLPAVPALSRREPFAKGYLFAPHDLHVRESAGLQTVTADDDRIELADVPASGTTIRKNAPVLTLLVHGPTEDDCAKLLKEYAERLYVVLEEQN